MLLWPWRDLPADHAAFVAINRLSARGLIPAARDKVDFQPDAAAEKEWQKALLSRCGLEIPVDEKLTRGQFAALIWHKLENVPAKPWERQKPDDADADGVPDLNDPQPFGAFSRSGEQAEMSSLRARTSCLALPHLCGERGGLAHLFVQSLMPTRQEAAEVMQDR